MASRETLETEYALRYVYINPVVSGHPYITFMFCTAAPGGAFAQVVDAGGDDQACGEPGTQVRPMAQKLVLVVWPIVATWPGLSR